MEAVLDTTQKLQRLITGLSKTEQKTALSLLRSEKKSDNQEVTLFKLLLEGKFTDDEGLMKQISEDLSKQHYFVLRSHVYRKVLDACVISNRESLFANTHYYKVMEANVLYAKGLVSDAVDLIEKIIEEKKENESYTEIIELLYSEPWLTHLIESNPNSNTRKEMRDLFELSLERLQSRHRLQKINDELVSITKRSVFLRNKAQQELVQMRLTELQEKINSAQFPFAEKLYLRDSIFNAYVLQAKFEQAYAIMQDLFPEIQKNQRAGKLKPFVLIAACLRFMNICLFTGKYDRIQELYEELITLTANLGSSGKIFSIFGMMAKAGDKSMVTREDLEKFEAALKELPQINDNTLHYVFQIHQAVLNWNTGNRTAAIELIEALGSGKAPTEVAADKVEISRILRVMYGAVDSITVVDQRIRFKDEVFQLRAKQLWENLRKKKDNYGFELLICNFFKGLQPGTPADKYRQGLADLEEEIQAAALLPENCYYKTMMHSISFNRWMMELKSV